MACRRTEDLNDILLNLVVEHGLKAVLRGTAVACYRLEESTANDEEPKDSPESWETDAKTIESILPLLIHEE